MFSYGLWKGYGRVHQRDNAPLIMHRNNPTPNLAHGNDNTYMKKWMMLAGGILAVFHLWAEMGTQVVNGIAWDYESDEDLGVTSLGNAFHAYASEDELIGAISIPSVLGGYPVVSIKAGAFNRTSCQGITSVTIPSSVQSISGSAFANCNRLASVSLPDGLKYMGHDVFYRCTSLRSITLPSSLTNLGACAFQECRSLTTISIPLGIKFIGEDTFNLSVAVERPQS